MGVRVYNPATGRFLQKDPIYGGNANAYVYPADPVNATDISGQYSCYWNTKDFSLTWRGTKYDVKRTCYLSNSEVRGMQAYGVFQGMAAGLVGAAIGALVAMAAPVTAIGVVFVGGLVGGAYAAAVFFADKEYEDRCSRRRGMWVSLRLWKSRGWTNLVRPEIRVGCR